MSEQKIISEATPVRIGLVLAFLGVFGGAIWWASSVNSKLDSIISNQAIVGNSITEIKTVQTSVSKDLADLTLRVAIIESRNGELKK